MLRPFSRVFVSILFSLIGYLHVEAQELPTSFQQVGDLEDYSSVKTNCIFQDSRDLIWIGTDLGLDRWDGSSILSYPYKPSNPHCMPSKGVSSITEDNQNNLWLLSNDDFLLKFDVENEVFTRIIMPWDSLYDCGYYGLEREYLRYIKYDTTGIIWLGTTNGLHGYCPDQNSVFRIPCDEEFGLETGEIFNIEFDTTGVMWVNAGLRIYYYDPDKGRLIPQLFDGQDLYARRIFFYEMSMDNDGSFWIVGGKPGRPRLIKFNPYTGTTNIVGSDFLSKTLTKSAGIEVDNQDKIWILSYNRVLLQYDPLTDNIEKFLCSELPTITGGLFEDSQGNIFISTVEGIKALDVRASRIKMFNLNQTGEPGNHFLITKVLRDKHSFWIGTYKSGLKILDTETGIIANYRRGNETALESDYIVQIFKDKNDRIWVWAGRGLHRYDPKMDRFKPLLPDDVVSIATDEEGIFWILSFDEIIRFDPITLDTLTYPLQDDFIVFRGRIPLFAPIYINSEGDLWIEGGNGVIKIDPLNGNWIHQKLEGNNESRYNFKDVSVIYYDSKDRIWIGTDMGISRIDIHPGSDSITVIEDFPQYPIQGGIINITEDAAGNIWLGSYTGIHVIMPDGAFYSFSHKDGLPESPKMIWSVDSDSEGSIYAGAYNFVEIQPDFLKPNEIIPPVLLTGFSLSGNRIFPGEESPLKKSVLFAERIDLNHDQNFFRIEFSALNYDHPERNQYRYRLIGVDMDTIHAGGRSYAEYTDLAPGTYTFWVTGSNNTGLLNPEGKSIKIRIHPPWYRSYLALGFYLLFIITLLIAYIRFRTFKLHREKVHLESEVRNRTEEIRQKNEQILELDSLKTRFFNNISHEFRTLVTMVKAPAETIMETEKLSRNGGKAMEIIFRNTTRLMKLVNQLLDISRIDKQSMRLMLSEENTHDFVREIAVSFAALAEANGIQYLYNIPRTDGLVWLDADKLEKIINNLLSNAFKFTEEGGTVRLELTQNDQEESTDTILEISVSDTGKGIPEEEQGKVFDRFYQVEANLRKEGGGTGIGLALTRDLVNLMHGTLELVSIPDKGSTFTVSIPVGKNHLADGEYTISESKIYLKESAHVIPQFNESNLAKTVPEVKDAEEAKKPILLVVEDNADIRWFLSNKLGTDFTLVQAVDGSAGLKLATEHMPDLIITDLMMPRMDGYELCKKLKSDVRTSHIPIIMLTAKATLDDKLEGLETGADDYISKPFDIEEVRIRAKNLIDQRRKLREKFGKEIILDPLDVVITPVDEKFLIRAMDVVDTHMGDASFDISAFSDKMNMSRSTLFRKLEALTNLSPVEFIRNLRLKRAASLLKQQFGNVSEVALEVGFSNPSYFAQVFKKAFSVTPAQFAKS